MRKIFAIYFSILILSISAFAQSEKVPCPLIYMTEPLSITSPGDTITFSVNVENEKVFSKLKYDWSVSSGTIIEEQGTSTIRIATTPEMGSSTVTAKVIVQNLPAECSREFFGNAALASTIRCELMEDYGKITTPSEKSMIDNVFMTLFDNPEYNVFFRLTSDKGESIEQTKSRINRIIKYAKYRGMDKSRFTFALDKSKTDYYLTTAAFIPKNSELPECENCEIIKGADVK